MGYYLVVCISVLAFSVISCGSSRNDAAWDKNHESADTAQISRMQPDTIPDMPPPPGPTPAPGTLKLQGKIIKIHSDGKNNSTIYEIKVLKTLGIGAGTPSVVRNDTIKVVSSKKSSEITGKMNVVCLIRQRRSMAQSQDSAPAWQMLEWVIKND
jgi:hypothetical protein